MMSFLKALPTLIGLMAAIWRSVTSAKDRALGRAEATTEALEKQAQENKKAIDAANKAEAEHSAHPNDDSAFDSEFQRKGP